jgi:hypothetical protein
MTLLSGHDLVPSVLPVAELEDVDVTVDEDVGAGLVLMVTAWCS